MKDEIVFVRSGESLLLHFARHLRFTSTSSDVKSIRIAVQVTSQRVRKIYCSIVILEEMVWKLIRNRVIICVYLLLYRKKVLHRHLLIVSLPEKSIFFDTGGWLSRTSRYIRERSKLCIFQYCSEKGK